MSRMVEGHEYAVLTRFEIAQPVIEAELALPYVIGKSDCFIMGLRIAAAFGHHAVLEQYLGRYSTLKGAHRVMKRLGHASLATLMKDHFEPCAPAQCQFGDLVVIQMGPAEHLGVCAGARFVTKTSGGRSDCDLSYVTAAFRT